METENELPHWDLRWERDPMRYVAFIAMHSREAVEEFYGN